MAEFKNKKLYEEILDLEKIYNNTPMQYIKENLHQLKLKKRELWKANCKRNDIKIGKFRLFENLLEYETEKAYLSKNHPIQIPFISLIKMCYHLEIDIKEILKEPVKNENKTIKRTSRTVWTNEKISIFINDYNSFGISQTADKYKLNEHTVVRYYQTFTSK